MAKRFLNVHEYVSMQLMEEYGVPVPRGAVATTPDEAEAAYTSTQCGGGIVLLRLRSCGVLTPWFSRTP